MDLAIRKAREMGAAAVTVRSCYHTGRLGTYAQQAAEEEMIAIVMVNAGGGGQCVTPFGGAARRLATNPIAMGAPGDGMFPILLDFATSMAPEGKIRDYARRGEHVPEGWLINAKGEPTTDPNDFYAEPGGAILPVGGQVGYKGFGLALFVDILAGALSGAGCCNASDVPARDGILIIAIDPHHFAGAKFAREQIVQMVEHVKSCPTAPGVQEVYAPGEIEFRQAEYRRRHGIPLDDTTSGELKAIAKELGVDWQAVERSNGEVALPTKESPAAKASSLP